MRYVPAVVAEAFEWMDAFSQVTGVLPSVSAMIYSELLMCPSVAVMLSQISQRDIFLSCLENTDPAQHKREFRNHRLTFDGALEQNDPAAFEKRINHYFSVFRHHGFERKLIEKIIDHMSPSSSDRPRVFSLENVDVSEFFDSTPFTPREVDDDEDEMDDDSISVFVREVLGSGQMRVTMQDHQRLAKAVDPSGWVAMLRELKFDIIPESIQREHYLGMPSFFVNEDKGGPFPVFIVSASRNAYDQHDSAARAMKEMVQHQLAMNGVERALLFYGTPSVVADDKDMSEGLVYWGEVFWDSTWGGDDPPPKDDWIRQNSQGFEGCQQRPRQLQKRLLPRQRPSPDELLVRASQFLCLAQVSDQAIPRVSM